MTDNFLAELRKKSDQKRKQEIIKELISDYRRYLNKYDLDDLIELDNSDHFSFGERHHKNIW